MSHDTIPSRLFERAQLGGGEPAYFAKDNEFWQVTSWASYTADAARAAKALLALGVTPGQTIALLAANRPEWAILTLGAMMIGARPASLYAVGSRDEARALLAHCEARVLLVGTPSQAEHVRSARPELPRLAHVIALAPVVPDSERGELSWPAFQHTGDERVLDAEVRAHVARVRADDVATIVYAAGDGGMPRGSLLSHQNLAFTCDTVRKLLRIQASDTTLSYLPLSHVSAQLFTIYGPICAGYAVYYAESLRSAPDDLRELQPSMVFSVPRIWERLHVGMESKLALVNGPRTRLVAWARRIATRLVEVRSEGKEPSMELYAQYELAERLVLSELKRSIGLAGARLCLSGAAPLGESTLSFFASLGLQLLEAYGQAESGGPLTMNQLGRTRFGSAGVKLPGTELTIAGDGEVIAKGPHVFLGYHRDPEATERALRSGRLATGDLGRLDGEGFLRLIGRKRDLLVTATGKHVVPQRIEALLRADELVRDVLLIGERRRYLTALVTVDEDVARTLGLGEPFHENAIVRQRVEERIAAVNGQLSIAEQVRRFTILPRPFDEAHGELTPALKVKRQRVEELWAIEIEAMYVEETHAREERTLQ